MHTGYAARELAGARILVAGAGLSGVSAARVLLDHASRVTVTDTNRERLDRLAGPDSPLGRNPPVELATDLATPPPGTDLVVTSPGLRPDTPLLRAATRAGIEIVGDVELAWRIDQDRPEGPAEWLAITGTNGKTTTVGMLEAILLAAGRDAVACGNVGLPVTDAIRAGGHRVLAVELSSFQLEWSHTVRPAAAVVLNLSADHLDWHGSMEAYARAKARIYGAGTVAVHNVDDPDAAALAAGHEGVGFTLSPPADGQLGVHDGVLLDRAFADATAGAELARVDDIRPAAPHNIANALAAAALARAHGVPARAVADGLSAFAVGGHRSVQVGEYRGIRFVDDSKATNPHAARAALTAHERVVWVAGGLLKGADIEALVAATADRMAGAVLLGADRAAIAAALARHAPDLPVRLVDGRDDGAMREVVTAAAELARPGDVVLLAPAAASMDMFTDYAHRGRAFVAAVGELAAQHPAGDPS